MKYSIFFLESWDFATDLGKRRKCPNLTMSACPPKKENMSGNMQVGVWERFMSAQRKRRCLGETLLL